MAKMRIMTPAMYLGISLSGVLGPGRFSLSSYGAIFRDSVVL